MGGAEEKFVKEAFESNYIAPAGAMIDRLENDVASFVSEDLYGCALSSATAGLDLLFDYLQIEKGDIVISSDLTFIASIAPAVHRGATPYFVDSDKDSWTMAPEALEEAVADCHRRNLRVKAVVAVDLYGECCDYAKIGSICAKYGIPLIEDAAEALGASYTGADGKPHKAGSAGTASVISFNGNKIITTSGGGMVLSQNRELVEHMRFLSTQAREQTPWYEHRRAGYNYRMSNISAAIGVGQMEILEKKCARRGEIRKAYGSLLSGFTPIKSVPGNTGNNWLSVFILPDESAATPIDLINTLATKGIEARPIWKPMHMQPLFKSAMVTNGGKESKRIFNRGICLPTGEAMNEEDIKEIAEIIRDRIRD